MGIRVVLDCTRHTLAFGVNNENPVTLFWNLPPVAYVPAVDLRDCSDKVRLLSSVPHIFPSANVAQASVTSPTLDSRPGTSDAITLVPQSLPMNDAFDAGGRPLQGMMQSTEDGPLGTPGTAFESHRCASRRSAPLFTPAH